MPATYSEMVQKARKLASDFKDISDEQKESQTFWNRFFEVFGQDRFVLADFEKRITKSDGDDGRIDVFWPSELIIEHKSKGKSLDKAKSQATAYLTGIDEYEYPKRLIVSDFDKIRIYSYNNWDEYEEIKLSELYNNLEKFDFMSGHVPMDFSKNNEEVTIKTAKSVAKFVDQIENSGNYSDLGLFLTRLIFLMYSEDTSMMRKGIIRQLFHSKTKKDGSNMGEVIDKIFRVVGQDDSNRSKNLEADYTNLPYLNGPLFSKKIEVVDFDENLRISLIKLFNLDWKGISPSLFGSLFQQVMSKDDRKILGTHYTSDLNIKKVIDDLFLDGLKSEFGKIKGESKQTKKKLQSFQAKLGKITLLDPACGCGNFLVMAYKELRLLEFEVLKKLAYFDDKFYDPSTKQVKLFDVSQSIYVKPSSLFGIEIDDFAAYVCQLSILIADAQVNDKMSNYFIDEPIENIPIKKIATIHSGNALDIDWENVVDKESLTHILGNPPFHGYSKQTATQKEDMKRTFGRKTGSLDYVAAWFQKSVKFIQDTNIKIGYVSTNSICQGEQVTLLWENLLKECGIYINFAHQAFQWKNNAPKAAQVQVIIIGLWTEDVSEKHLYRYPKVGGKGEREIVKSINPYLETFAYQFIKKRAEPLCEVKPMIYGSKATDNGGLFLSPDEKAELIKGNPELEKYVKRFMGSDECIKNKERYCLWLKDYIPSEITKSKFIQSRLEKVREFRLKSKKNSTKVLAKTPYLFGEVRQPSRNYLLIPRHSSEKREYIPTGYFSADIIVGDSAFCVPDADEYTFGIFSSKMHMTWMKYVCGRLESRYRYSNTIVYNNFPWPDKPSNGNIKKVVEASKNLLKIRNELEKKSSLADIYTPNSIPKSLLDAHNEVNKAVDKCYRPKAFKNDAERMEFLFNRYSEIVIREEEK